MILPERYELGDGASHWDIWEKILSGRGNSMCKMPEVEFFLALEITKKSSLSLEKDYKIKLWEEIFKDQVKLSNCICMRIFHFFLAWDGSEEGSGWFYIYGRRITVATMWTAEWH